MTTTTNTQARTYYSVNEIAREASGYFFSQSAMRFFNSRLCQGVYQGQGGVYFVTSERMNYNSPRMYTVREYNTETRQVSTVGEFNVLTYRQAKREAARLAIARGE